MAWCCAVHLPHHALGRHVARTSPRNCRTHAAVVATYMFNTIRSSNPLPHPTPLTAKSPSHSSKERSMGEDPASGERGRRKRRSLHAPASSSPLLPPPLSQPLPLPLLAPAGQPQPLLPLLLAPPLKGQKPATRPAAPPPPPALRRLGLRASSCAGTPAGHSRMRSTTRAQKRSPSATSCWPTWGVGGGGGGGGGERGIHGCGGWRSGRAGDPERVSLCACGGCSAHAHSCGAKLAVGQTCNWRFVLFSQGGRRRGRWKEGRRPAAAAQLAARFCGGAGCLATPRCRQLHSCSRQAAMPPPPGAACNPAFIVHAPLPHVLLPPLYYTNLTHAHAHPAPPPHLQQAAAAVESLEAAVLSQAW